MIISHEMFIAGALVKNVETTKHITQLNHFEAGDESNSYVNIKTYSYIIICKNNIGNTNRR